jgi:methionyl-tRNA formyltransferase
MKSLRVVFMGTPQFAVTTLERMIARGVNVVGVVTATDKPAGRGQKIMTSAVKDCALAHHLPILQPDKLRDPEFLESLAAWQADLFVVVAFRMLPEVVWKMPAQGTINLHGSLLPKYRGAAPIHWAIMNGEKETGVTTFFINEHIDQGAIIDRTTLAIGADETLGEVHDRMMHIGAETLCDTVEKIANGEVITILQDSLIVNENDACLAPKLSKEIAQIDWHQPVQKVHDFIRGMSPFPCAWTLLEGKNLRIYKGKRMTSTQSIEPGSFESDGKTYIHYGCIDGQYAIEDLQLEGKKRMGVEEFLRGYRING